MSLQYVESFVETCMDAGLSKAATAELLQRRSAIHAAEQSPAFAEGYHMMKLAMPQGTIRVRPGYVVKSANIGAVAKGLGMAAGGVGGMLGGAAKNVFHTVAKRPNAAKVIGGGLATGGIGYGIGQYLDNDYTAAGVPVITGGGMYNPEQEADEYKNELNRYSSGIADTNKDITDSADRRRVLQQAVHSNSPQSALALKELKMLNSKVDGATKVRQKHLEALNNQGATTSKRLESITNRQQTLRDRQKSPFWRAMHWATLRNPDKSYGSAIDELQAPAAALSHENQLINDQRERLPYWKGKSYSPRSSTQLQREFFPTN